MTDLSLDGLARFVRNYADACLVVPVMVDGRTWQVEIPLGQVRLMLHQAASETGVTMPRSVGANCRSVGGFFSSIKKAYKGATRAIKRALPKTVQRVIHKVEKTAEWGARKAWNLHKTAKQIVQSDAFAAGLVGASFLVPALAPASAALIAARTMMKQVEAGKQAAQAIARGFQATPALLQAVAKRRAAEQNAKSLVTMARGGNPVAQQFMGALRQMR